jgi:hypothetical protein
MCPSPNCLFIDAFSVRTINIFSFILLVLLVVRIPIESVDATHQNRALGDEQLDDGIVDTLVSALRRLQGRSKAPHRFLHDETVPNVDP